MILEEIIVLECQDQIKQFAYGTPNACNKCHTEKTVKWAANQVEKWYGKARPKHYSDNLLAGYYGDKAAFYKVIANTQNPEIIRATAVNQYVNQPLLREEVNRLLSYVADSSALVRNEVVLAASQLNIPELDKKITPLLLDSVRLVRISAARYFALKNSPLITQDIYNKPYNEYLEELNVNADFASGQHQIALFYQAKGEIDKAIEAYKKAIKIDNYYNRARINLALLLYKKGKVKEAEQLYLKVTAQEPDYSYPYYMLGLLYNEIGNPEKSLKYLALACKKEPIIPRAFYNYALKLQERKQYKKSLQVLEKVLKNYPYDETLLYAKLLAQLKLKETKKALETCGVLLQINPKNKNYQQIYASLQRELQQ